ncbi:MAG: ATP-binding cassette domain-containing protein [Terrimesophilobacter sp.]
MAEDGLVAVGARNVRKTFGHVNALTDTSIAVRPGEIVCLFGDNGAGKSTLMKILCGLQPPDPGGGTVIIDNKDVVLDSIRDAQRHGLGAVHQDLALAPDLSVLENMFLGHEIFRSGLLGRLGFLDRRSMAKQADAALRKLAIRLPSLNVATGMLSGGQKQALAVARAVMWSTKAVLMDEPTAALGATQADIVCQTMRSVADAGLGVLVVSHDIPRMLDTADRVAILRHGRIVKYAPAHSMTVPEVVTYMVGGKVDAA